MLGRLLGKLWLLLLLLLCSSVSVCNSAHAGWLERMVDKAKNAFAPKKPEVAQLTPADVVDYPAHYGFSRVTEPVHGSPLFFLEAGDKAKPSVLLVHGLGEAASKDWLEVIPALEKHYHVYAIDLPGFGLSKGVYFKYSPEEYSRVLNWFIGEYLNNQTVLVGHSMGAAVSLYFAATHPEKVKQLILADAAGILERTTFVKHLVAFAKDDPELPLGLRRIIAQTQDLSSSWVENTGKWFDPTELIRDNERIRKVVLFSNTNANAALALIETDFSKLTFARLPPTHLLWGGQDKIAPLRTAKLLLHRLPNVQLQVLPQAGHVPMKSHPPAFNALLLDAITKAPNKESSPLPSNLTREFKCKHDEVTYFYGFYEDLSLQDCKLAILDNVTAQSFSADNSIVRVDNSRLGTKGKALQLKASALTATASVLTGKLLLDGTRLDLAGVDIHSNAAIEVSKSSTIIMSLSQLDTPNYRGAGHGFFHLDKGRLDEIVLNRSHGEIH